MALVIQGIGIDSIPLNVKDYGAVGNGTANDSTAIQAAITALSPGGGLVWFPAGTYKIDTVITVTSPITLRGEGAKTSIIKRGADTCIRMVDVRSPNVTIEHLGFDADETGRSSALELAGGNRFVIWTYHNQYAADYLTVQHCRFVNGRGFYLHYYYDATASLRLKGAKTLYNYFETITGSYGRDIVVPISSYSVILGNTIIGRTNSQVGLQVYECDWVNVSHNVIDLSPVPDIATAATIQSCYGIDFHNNVLKTDTNGVALSCIIEGDNGVNARQFNAHLNIHDNHMSGVGMAFVTMSNTTDVLFHNNVTDSATYLLLVAGSNNLRWRVFDNPLTWVTTPISGTLGSGSYLRGGNGGFGSS